MKRNIQKYSMELKTSELEGALQLFFSFSGEQKRRFLLVTVFE
jgi:hypothetical protein